jgi:hypothetical protein
METSKKIKTDASDLSKETVKRKILLFFKGCEFGKCLSAHCPHFIGEPQLAELRADPEAGLNPVIEMIQKGELKISCDAEKHGGVFLSEEMNAFKPILEFSLTRALNLQSEDRLKHFGEIKAVAENELASQSVELKHRVLEMFENGIADELSAAMDVIAKKVKDADLFETVVLFFLSFSFIFDIENFHNLSSIKKFLAHLSLPDIYTPEFREGLQAAEVTNLLNSQNIERVNENLQNLFALQLAELDAPNKFDTVQAQNLATLSSSISFFCNINSFLPSSQRLSVKLFVNETLANDFDVKNSTLVYMREGLSGRPDNPIIRVLTALPINDKFTYLTYPILLPVETKVDVVHFESRILQNLELQSAVMNSNNPWMFFLSNDVFLELKLRRDNLLEDALNELANKGKGATLRRGLKIKFQGEPGVDEGGLTKEFFQLLTQQLFDPSFGMFIEKNERFLWFDSKSFECGVNFELVGTLLGLALYNQTILPLKFPLAIYKKLKQANHDTFSVVDEVGLEDLKEIEPEVYSTMVNILKTDWTMLETGMNFTVTYEFYGTAVNYELIPGGAGIDVTESNKKEFVNRYINWYFNESVHNQFEPFCRGFYNVLSKRTLGLFTANDLFMAICGSEELSFQSLRHTTKYEDYTEHSETIAHFWQILEHDFSIDQKRAFLKFLTGSDRAPLKGLGDIKMTVTRYGPDSEHLPASHTCFNHLLLPDYKNYQKLRAKLLKAVENCEGFGLF